MELLAAYWVAFLIFAVVFYVLAFVFGARGMQKMGKSMDSFFDQGFGGFFKTWFTAQLPAVICAAIASINGILFIIGVILAIINHSGA